MAAEQGHPKAEYALGNSYMNGFGVAQNEAEGIKWIRKAAEKGLPEAQCRLAGCYLTGDGVETDASEAAKWFRAAAEQGLAEAQCQLAHFYFVGKAEIKKDAAEGARWLRKAVDQGYAEAQYQFGKCYARGRGVNEYPGGAYQYASGVLTNEQGGSVMISGDANLKGSFVNRGVVVNRARIAFDENATYSSVGTFNNAEGGVWAFSYLAGVNENFHLKKHLEDAAFQAEYSETPYNKYNQKPTFTVDGETLSAADYTRSFYSEVQGKYVQECVKTGSFIMRVTIINAYCDYAGSVAHTYSIVPTTIHVSNSSEYSTVYSDAGYNKIVLDADIAVSGYYVGTDCTLDLNGHCITIKRGYSSYSVNYFRVYGTLTGMAAVADPANFTPSEAQASVIVE